MMKSHLSLVAMLAAVLAIAEHAESADTRLAGKSLALAADQLKLRVVARDQAIGLGSGPGSEDDPVLHGATLRILSIEGDVFDASYALPAEGWRYVGRSGSPTGYAFHGPDPIRSVRLRAGKVISVRGRGPFGVTFGGDPAPVRVILTLGSQRYCTSFGGTVEFEAGLRYRAKNAPAPSNCPLPYDTDAAWLCRPGMANNQCFVNSLDATIVEPDLATNLEPHAGAEDHPYDCFYVYPTVDLLGAVGNVPDVTDPEYVSFTLDPLLSQAARFNGLCRIFAPHYRQITFSTFNFPSAAQYLDLAYKDVLDAWRLYVKQDNGGRDVVIMGHSQGTFMTARLLQEEFDPSPALRSQLIAALLIGGNVGVPAGDTVGGTFQNIPLCTTPEETGCVVAYHTFAEGFPPVGDANAIGVDPDLDVACTNPAALGGGEGQFSAAYFPTHSNQPLFDITPDLGFGTPFVKFAQFYAGECVLDDTNRSYLEIRANPGPGDQRMDLVPYDDPILTPTLLGTHILDYNWAIGELLDLVATKAAAMP